MSGEIISALQCNVCMVVSVYEKCSYAQEFRVLSSCSGCNLVRYCGNEHQNLDWRIHREICVPLKKLKKRLNLSNPFEISGIPRCKEDIEKASLQLKYILIQKMGRKLVDFEEELLSLPAYCPICFQFQKLKLVCLKCGNQAYCSEEHQQLHREEHAKECNLFVLHYSPYKSLETKKHSKLKLLQQVEDLKDSDTAEAFEEAYRVAVPASPANSFGEYQLFSLVSDHSCIFTLCYALSFLNMSEMNGTTFVALIIGATYEPMLWFQEHHCRFFFNQYPNVLGLDLHFIGPEVQKPNKTHYIFKHLGINRTVNAVIYPNVFQIYRQLFTERPHIIIAFNCGFSEYSPFINQYSPKDNTCKRINTWHLGLVELLKILNTPIVFTSFTKQEAVFDMAALQNAATTHELKIKIQSLIHLTKNPFRDLRPNRQWYGHDKEAFFYRNGYIQIIKTKQFP